MNNPGFPHRHTFADGCGLPHTDGAVYAENAKRRRGHVLQQKNVTTAKSLSPIFFGRECRMDESQRLAGFRAMLESLKANAHYLKEPDGSLRLWRDLSPEGKIEYIVRDAALCNVPFEPFADAVRESVDGASIEEAALRLAMRSGQDLHDLEKLFPDDGRTETTTLVERVRDLLNAASAEHENETRPTANEQAELFQEMRADYAAGKRHDAHGSTKDAYQRILDGKAKAPAVTEKDKGIDR